MLNFYKLFVAKFKRIILPSVKLCAFSVKLCVIMITQGIAEKAQSYTEKRFCRETQKIGDFLSFFFVLFGQKMAGYTKKTV
jgi:hypothetical protein